MSTEHPAPPSGPVLAIDALTGAYTAGELLDMLGAAQNTAESLIGIQLIDAVDQVDRLLHIAEQHRAGDIDLYTQKMDSARYELMLVRAYVFSVLVYREQRAAELAQSATPAATGTRRKVSREMRKVLQLLADVDMDTRTRTIHYRRQHHEVKATICTFDDQIGDTSVYERVDLRTFEGLRSRRLIELRSALGHGEIETRVYGISAAGRRALGSTP